MKRIDSFELVDKRSQSESDWIWINVQYKKQQKGGKITHQPLEMRKELLDSYNKHLEIQY